MCSSTAKHYHDSHQVSHQQRRNSSHLHETISSKSSSAHTQNHNHHHHHMSQLDQDHELNLHFTSNGKSLTREEQVIDHGSNQEHAPQVLATSSPRGREQSEEVEERGRSRLREDKFDVTDDSLDDISLMGFKTGSKHTSPAKMKKVRG